MTETELIALLELAFIVVAGAGPDWQTCEFGWKPALTVNTPTPPTPEGE